MATTSPYCLHRGLQAARVGGQSGVAKGLLAQLRPASAFITVGDFHPATLSWLGTVAGNPIVPLGVDRFGQSGDILDLYRAYGIDTNAILDDRRPRLSYGFAANDMNRCRRQIEAKSSLARRHGRRR